MTIENYLQKKYQAYKNEIPADCLQFETLAGQIEMFVIRRRAAEIMGSGKCPKYLPLETFIELVEDYLQGSIQK